MLKYKVVEGVHYLSDSAQVMCLIDALHAFHTFDELLESGPSTSSDGDHQRRGDVADDNAPILHGDIRGFNIVVKGQMVKLIDYDFACKKGRYPLGYNHDLSSGDGKRHPSALERREMQVARLVWSVGHFECACPKDAQHAQRWSRALDSLRLLCLMTETSSSLYEAVKAIVLPESELAFPFHVPEYVSEHIFSTGSPPPTRR